MKYLTTILDYDENIEDILTIQVENTILEVFGLSIPYPIQYDKQYLIELEVMVFDEYMVQKTIESPKIRKIGNSLRYEIIGNLFEGQVKVNHLIFEDSILNSDFGYLDNQTIIWEVDRIDVDFDCY